MLRGGHPVEQRCGLRAQGTALLLGAHIPGTMGPSREDLHKTTESGSVPSKSARGADCRFRRPPHANAKGGLTLLNPEHTHRVYCYITPTSSVQIVPVSVAAYATA